MGTEHILLLLSTFDGVRRKEHVVVDSVCGGVRCGVVTVCCCEGVERQVWKFVSSSSRFVEFVFNMFLKKSNNHRNVI